LRFFARVLEAMSCERISIKLPWNECEL
jgi:hypothetical protein